MSRNPLKSGQAFKAKIRNILRGTFGKSQSPQIGSSVQRVYYEGMRHM